MCSPMRIVQVVHWFLPRHSSGAEVYTYQLASALAQRHEVSIYCREDGHAVGANLCVRPPEARFYEEDDVYRGLPVHRVYYNPPPGPTYLARKALARFHNPRIEQSFAAYLDRVRPAVVHFQHLFKLSASLIAVAQGMGIPTVVTLHDYWFLCDNGQLLRPGLRVCTGPQGGLRCAGCAEAPLPSAIRPLLNPFLLPLFIYRTRALRRYLHRADAIIAPSAYLREAFMRHGFPPERILLCDHGTDTAWLPDVVHVLGCSSPAGQQLRFGYIGTIAPHKGLHVLLQAFRDLNAQNAELRVYGDLASDPSYTAALQELVEGQAVYFMGPFAHEEIGRVLSELDLLVVPSVWPENSPLTIHEARAARLPVLASDVGGMSDLVREGRAGWLFRAGDAEDLRRRLAEILQQPELLVQVRDEIRPVKGIEENAHELDELYRRIVCARGRRDGRYR